MAHLLNLRDWLIQAAYTTVHLFVKNGLTNHAAATAFYFLLSAAPLALLVSYASQLLTHVAQTSNLGALVLTAFHERFRLDQLMAMGFIPRDAEVGVGGAGLLTLIISSRGLVSATDSAFRIVFPEGERRRMVFSWLLPLIIIPTVFLLVILAVLAQGALSFLVEYDFLTDTRGSLLQGANMLLSFSAVWGLIFAAYWGLPLKRPNPRLAMWLSLICALVLSVLFAGFKLFFQVEHYRSLYGALGGVVFILIGAYFACLIFYFWAQCLQALGKVDLVAFEKLFMATGGPKANRLESLVFGRIDRLLAKFGRLYAPGDTLIREGDTDQDAYFLASGSVELFRSVNGRPHRLGELGAGEMFGEMAYLLGEKRSASVIAKTEITALVLPPAMIEELMQHSAPLARRVIASLSQRLQKMNQAITN